MSAFGVPKRKGNLYDPHVGCQHRLWIVTKPTFAEIEARDIRDEQHGDGHADGAAHGADHELGAVRDEAEHHARYQSARLCA